MAKRLDIPAMGRRIASLRRERGLSQQALAVKAGLHQAAIARLERGNQKAVRADTIMGLAEGLEISADYLLALGEGLPGHLVYERMKTEAPHA